MNDVPILQLEQIYKSFPGESHVLLGENGAGKSTLMKILTGIYLKDSGNIIVRDQEVTINNPHKAFELGISMMYQESNLAMHLSIAKNIFLGREMLRSQKLGIIKWSAL